MAPTAPTPAGPRVAPHLPTLPEELVSNISLKLGSDDIFAFRLTCRALEQKSFHEFATEYFKEKGFLITSDSLKALVGIAFSEKLRGHLHTINILPTLFSDRAFKCCNGDDCMWKKCVRQTEHWHHYVRDQKRIKRTGEDLEMLTKAFKGLPALTQLQFVDDPNSISPLVDVRGLARSTRLTNHKPTHFPDRPGDREYYRWRNHVWNVVMRALAVSDTTTLLHFGTDLDQIKNALSVSTNLSFVKPVRKGLAIAFSNLHTMRLNISSRKQSHFNLDEDDGIDEEQGANNIGTFAKLLPSLAHLQLTFTFSPSSQRLCGRFLARINSGHLRSLKLGKAFLGSKVLLSVLAEAKELREFTAVEIDLRSGNWRNVLKQLQKLEMLEHVQLRSLFEKMDTVSFLKSRPKPANGSIGTSTTQPPTIPHGESDLSDFFDGYDSEADFTSDDDGDTFNSTTANNGKDESMSTLAGDSSIAEDGGASPTTTNMSAVPLPVTNDATSKSTQPESPSTATTDNDPQSSQDQDLEDNGNKENKDLLGPGPSCGHQILLENRAEVEHWLPIFIKEYHVLDNDDMMDAHDHSLVALSAMIFGPGGGVLPPPMTIPAGLASQPTPNGGNVPPAGTGGSGNDGGS